MPDGDGWGASEKSATCYNHKPVEMKKVARSGNVILWKCPQCGQKVEFKVPDKA